MKKNKSNSNFDKPLVFSELKIKDINVQHIIDYLLTKNRNPSAETKLEPLIIVEDEYFTPIDLVFESSLTLDIVRALDKEGFNFYSSDKNGVTFLHTAASNCKDIKALKFLFEEKKFNYAILDNESQTPFFHACTAGNIISARYFVEQLEIDINKKDIYGNTVLHDMLINIFRIIDLLTNSPFTNKHEKTIYGRYNNSLEIFEFLIRKKINIKATNNNNETVLDVICIKINEMVNKYSIGYRSINSTEVQIIDFKRNSPLLHLGWILNSNLYKIIVASLLAGAKTTYPLSPPKQSKVKKSTMANRSQHECRMDQIPKR